MSSVRSRPPQPVAGPSEHPPAPAPQVVEVRCVTDDVVIEGRVLRKGELVRLPAVLAADLVRESRAVYSIEVRCIEPVMCLGRFLAVDDVAICDEETARRLAGASYVVVLTPERLSGPLDPPKPRKAKPAARSPYFGEGKLKVRILEDGVNVGGETRDKGECDLYETQVFNLVVAGKAEILMMKSVPVYLASRLREAMHPSLA